jgi:hypothetical protein
MKNQNQNLIYLLNQLLLVNIMFPFFSNIEIIKGSKAVGVNIWIKPDDELEINAIVIGKIRNKLSVVDKKTFTLLEEMTKSVSGKLPLYLSIDGKGVLHKIIDFKPDGQLIDFLLPNANSNDFVIQDIIVGEKRKIISIVRKDKLEEILNKINGLGFDVLKLFLGPFSLSSIVHLLQENSTIPLPYYNLILKNNSLEGFEKNLDSSPDFRIEIESEPLNSNFIVPFSNCIHHFAENNSISIDYIEINNQIDNFRFRRLFQLCGWGILVFLLVSLLINFTLFDYYRQKNQLLVSQIGDKKEILNKIEGLKRLVKTKENFFKNNSFQNNPLFAYYSDRLAKEVPSGITLGNLNFFPLQKQSTSKDELNFLYGKILVSGYTHNSNYLDLWIKTLKSLSWIQKIDIKSYSDNGTEPAKFVLEIDLKEFTK